MTIHSSVYEKMLNRLQNCLTLSDFFEEMKHFAKENENIFDLKSKAHLELTALQALSKNDFSLAMRIFCILSFFYPLSDKNLFLFAYCLFKEKRFDDALKLVKACKNLNCDKKQIENLHHLIQNKYHMETV